MIDFVTGLPTLNYWKGEIYNLILIIVNWLIKIVNYKLIKITFNTSKLAKVILDLVV